jgi:hypothetical protein
METTEMDRPAGAGNGDHGRYIQTAPLSEYLGVSKKFIEKNRKRIPGATKCGGIWLFSLPDIEKKLLSGQLLLPENDQKK